MKLFIKKIEDKQYVIKFGDQILEIHEKSENWNIEGINKFLILLASKTPENEKIEIIYDENEEDKIFKHICDLFNEFANSYNEKTENIKN